MPFHFFNQFLNERWCEGNDRKYVDTIFWHLLLADPENLVCYAKTTILLLHFT